MSRSPNKLNVHALVWQDKQLSVLDQRQLPNEVHYDIFTTAPDVAVAIKTMRVRGAPAIGIAAAYAVALSVQQYYSPENDAWQQRVYAGYGNTGCIATNGSKLILGACCYAGNIGKRNRITYRHND